jgi:hypothetical protein
LHYGYHGQSCDLPKVGVSHRVRCLVNSPVGGRIIARILPTASTKEKPGCWTRRTAFEQVRHGSNIQLLPHALVTPGIGLLVGSVDRPQ